MRACARNSRSKFAQRFGKIRAQLCSYTREITLVFHFTRNKTNPDQQVILESKNWSFFVQCTVTCALELSRAVCSQTWAIFARLDGVALDQRHEALHGEAINERVIRCRGEITKIPLDSTDRTMYDTNACAIWTEEREDINTLTELRGGTKVVAGDIRSGTSQSIEHLGPAGRICILHAWCPRGWIQK